MRSPPLDCKAWSNACRFISPAARSGALPWPGKLSTGLGQGLGYVISPLTWLRDRIQMASRPLWADFAVTAVIVSALMFFLSGGENLANGVIRLLSTEKTYGDARALAVDLNNMLRHYIPEVSAVESV